MKRACVIVDTPEGPRIENVVIVDENEPYTPPWGYLMDEADAIAANIPYLEVVSPEPSEEEQPDA